MSRAKKALTLEALSSVDAKGLPLRPGLYRVKEDVDNPFHGGLLGGEAFAYDRFRKGQIFLVMVPRQEKDGPSLYSPWRKRASSEVTTFLLSHLERHEAGNVREVTLETRAGDRWDLVLEVLVESGKISLEDMRQAALRSGQDEEDEP